MGEFFNIGDRTSFGNLLDAFYHFRNSTSPITVDVLALTDSFLERSLYRENFKGQAFGSDYLKHYNITFNSSKELNDWFYTERWRRLDLINSFKDFYSVKHFITLFDNPVDNELEYKFTKSLIESQFKSGELIFSYRKDLVETVLSGLIKTFYIDKAKTGNTKNEFVETMLDGHNLNDMPVLEPEPITIRNPLENSEGSHYEIEGIVLTNLMLFEFYHKFISQLPFDNVVCYEDIMDSGQIKLTYQDKTQVFNINDLPPRIAYQIQNDGSMKGLIEKKMNYGNYSKKKYFTNGYIVSEILNIEIDKIENRTPGFKQTLEKLGIIY